MKLYKVYLDMTIVISRLSKYRIYEYNHETPIVFMEANDPDEACFKTCMSLLRMILAQDASPKAEDKCKEIQEDIRVTKVFCA